jgi:localization factor PodJL
MTSGVPFNVTGVRPEAIETAREAARRSGLSLAQWLNSAIIDSAADTGYRSRPERYSERDEPRLAERLDEIAERLDRLSWRRPASPRAGGPSAAEVAELERAVRALDPQMQVPPDAPTSEPEASAQLADAIGQVNARLDKLIASTPSATDFERRISAIDRALEALNRAPPIAATAPSAPAESGLDGAIAEIAARQQALDDDTPPRRGRAKAATARAAAPDLSGLEQQLRAITQQIETLRRPLDAEPVIAALRRDLADIGRTMAEAAPRHSLDAIEAEIRAVAGRLDLGGTDAAALASVERGLAEIRDAISAMAPAESLSGFSDDIRTLSRKIDLLGTAEPDAEALQQLRAAVGELQAFSGRVASADALAALATEVRAIGGKVDRAITSDASSARGIERLARRIETLASSLDTRAAAGEGGIPAHFETLIKALTEKLETTHAPVAEQSLEQLEQQIVRLAQKLDASDARLGNLGAIERAMGELMAQLKEARVTAIEVAEKVARSAARDMVSKQGPPDVDHLKHEMAELRDSQTDIDRRTQDTLEAVHGTLERLVDRLAAIETDVQVKSTRLDAGPPAGRSSHLPLAETVSVAAGRSGAEPALPTVAVSRPAPARDRRPNEALFTDDVPLEPGSGSPRGRIAASPAERIAASEAALGGVKTSAPADPPGKANFIAAARRAAQAAASDSPTTANRSTEDGAQRPSIGTMIRDALTRHRRPLMIGIGIVLLAMISLQFVASMMGSGHQARIENLRQMSSEAPTPARDSGKPASAAADPDTPAATQDQAPAAPTAPGRQSDLGNGAGGVLATAPTTAQIAAAVPLDIGSPTGTTRVGAPGRLPATESAAAPTPPAARPAPAATASIPPPDKLPAAIGGQALRDAAAAGDPAAAYEVGTRFAEGRGVALNFEEAARWLERAANQGLAPAQYRLGSLYEKGHGVKRDVEAARKLYIAAADQGNAKAMHNLAVLYAEGIEGKPDYRMAAQWFRKAADRGIADSEYNLGILYARGIGVEQNLAESYKWFALAAQQGDQDAGKKREDVAARLDPQALVAAKLAVQTWTADPQPDEAVNVKAPPGGWDRPQATAPARSKAALGAAKRS